MARPGLKSEIQGEPFAKVVVWYWTSGSGHWKETDATITQAGWRGLTSTDVVLVQVLYNKQKVNQGKYFQEILVPGESWGTGDGRWWWKNDAHEYECGASGDVPQEVNPQDRKSGTSAIDQATRINLYNQAHEGVAWGT